ncbi:hypothetical protein [uncultured Psychroserpens sp.]|uniref:hypothetical protein n=1 Tax=uncultured Psychroserpens sp. TaxID=255436 RepID=UPI00345662E0
MNLILWCSYIIPNANFNTAGLIKAIVTHAAALTPPESEKMSTNNPSIKLIKIKSSRLLLTGNNKMKSTYGYGLM